MNWRLTRDAIGDPYIECRDTDETEDLRRGFSLMRELAMSDDTLYEIEPGVWRQHKPDNERWF